MWRVLFITLLLVFDALGQSDEPSSVEKSCECVCGDNRGGRLAPVTKSKHPKNNQASYDGLGEQNSQEDDHLAPVPEPKRPKINQATYGGLGEQNSQESEHSTPVPKSKRPKNNRASYDGLGEQNSQEDDLPAPVPKPKRPSNKRMHLNNRATFDGNDDNDQPNRNRADPFAHATKSKRPMDVKDENEGGNEYNPPTRYITINTVFPLPRPRYLGNNRGNGYPLPHPHMNIGSNGITIYRRGDPPGYPLYGNNRNNEDTQLQPNDPDENSGNTRTSIYEGSGDELPGFLDEY